jgi:hypothetical protein
MSHGVNYQCKSKRSSERPRVREVHEMPTEKLAPGQQGRAAIFVNNHLPGVKNNAFRWSRRRPEMQAARSSEKRKKIDKTYRLNGHVTEQQRSTNE